MITWLYMKYLNLAYDGSFRVSPLFFIILRVNMWVCVHAHTYIGACVHISLYICKIASWVLFRETQLLWLCLFSFTMLSARLPSYHTLANIAHQTLVNLSENNMLFFGCVSFITGEAKYLLKCLSTIYNSIMKLAASLNKNRMIL